MRASAVHGSVVAGVQQAVAPFAARLASHVERLVERAVAARVRELASRRREQARRTRPRRRAAMARWVADRRARRVPTFVIEATGLDTKTKIVARFGPDAVFVKGKPLPAAAIAAAKAAPAVTAKPPIVRKGGAARLSA